MTVHERQWTRLVVVFLLSVTVPVYGAATLNMVATMPCPLQSADSTPAVKVSSHHPCCQDAETAAKTGKPCKPTQECGVGTLFQVVASKSSFPVPSHHPVPSVDTTRFPSLTPAGIWRPPASL